MIKQYVWWWLFANVFVVQTSQASSIIETNVGVVSVAQESNPQRAALAQAIIKMSGLIQSTDHVEIRSALRDSGSYLSSYQYFTRDNESYYRGEFDRQKLQQLLRRAGLPIWGARRPDAIFWLSEQLNDDISIVADADDHQAKYVTQMQSSARGLNALLPLLDLDDTFNLAPVDVWGRFMPSIQKASARYNTEYVVAARLQSTALLRQASQIANRMGNNRETTSRAFRDSSAYSYSIEGINDYLAWYEQKLDGASNSFQASEFNGVSDKVSQFAFVLDWTIQGNNHIESGQFFADSKNELYTQLVNYYADTMGAKYAILPTQGNAGVVSLSIANIQSLSSVVALTRYLTDLTVVQSVQLESMQGTVGVFKVELIGNLLDLQSTLQLDAKLVSVDVINLDLNKPDVSHFFWNP